MSEPVGSIWLQCQPHYTTWDLHTMSLTPQRVLIHIFLGEEMRHLEVTQPGLELGRAGPLRLSHPPACPWLQNPDEKCWPRPLINCETSTALDLLA